MFLVFCASDLVIFLIELANGLQNMIFLNMLIICDL